MWRAGDPGGEQGLPGSIVLTLGGAEDLLVLVLFITQTLADLWTC